MMRPWSAPRSNGTWTWRGKCSKGFCRKPFPPGNRRRVWKFLPGWIRPRRSAAICMTFFRRRTERSVLWWGMSPARGWLIRATAIPGRRPLEILQRVNAQLCAENQANLFVTMILGIVETSTGRIEYGMGGHNPAILIPTAGEPVYEPSGGMPLGVFEDAKFGHRQIELKAGETLLVYTDGVTEAMNPERALFGEDRLKEAVRGQARLSPEQLTQQVVREVAKFARGAEPSDDITLLAIQHRTG
ncbi:MAG: serine/threonine-protein phosphatase [Verrucomicrobia bacterium]|nr:serine/threonine-protein phosphatase [Verrucomicrobiota bacterium]